MARPEREARQAPQDVQLSEAQLAALASAGGARWFVAFSEWMGRGHSAANARSVCATLHRLAAGLGVQHRSHPSQTFLEGEPVGLGADVPALKQRAREWLRKVGPVRASSRGARGGARARPAGAHRARPACANRVTSSATPHAARVRRTRRAAG